MKLSKHLKILLADTFVIYLKTHYFHWNVKGPLFPQLHKLFDDQYNEIYSAIDTIAEKIKYLDDNAPGSMSRFMELKTLEEVTNIPSASDMIKILLADHDKMIVLLNEVFASAVEENDQAVMNFLAERLDAHKKHRWMLKSSL